MRAFCAAKWCVADASWRRGHRRAAVAEGTGAAAGSLITCTSLAMAPASAAPCSPDPCFVSSRQYRGAVPGQIASKLGSVVFRPPHCSHSPVPVFTPMSWIARPSSRPVPEPAFRIMSFRMVMAISGATWGGSNGGSGKRRPSTSSTSIGLMDRTAWMALTHIWTPAIPLIHPSGARGLRIQFLLRAFPRQSYRRTVVESKLIRPRGCESHQPRFERVRFQAPGTCSKPRVARELECPTQRIHDEVLRVAVRLFSLQKTAASCRNPGCSEPKGCRVNLQGRSRQPPRTDCAQGAVTLVAPLGGG